MSLSNEIALVTGASRGIGKAIATALGSKGATVVGTATSASGAQGISDSFAASNIKGAGKVLNVTDPDSIESLIKDVQAEYAAPTILVNNAGITRDNLLMRMKDDEWNDVIETNLTSAFRMSKACLRGMMKARHGRIITITSVIGCNRQPGAVKLCRYQGGSDRFYQVAGKGNRFAWHYRERGCARFYRYGYDACLAAGTTRCAAGADCPRKTGDRRGCCQRGCLSGIRRCGLYYR